MVGWIKRRKFHNFGLASFCFAIYSFTNVPHVHPSRDERESEEGIKRWDVPSVQLVSGQRFTLHTQTTAAGGVEI